MRQVGNRLETCATTLPTALPSGSCRKGIALLQAHFVAHFGMSLNPLLESPPGAGLKDIDSILKECIARFSHPKDPLAAWKISFDEWVEAVKNFHEAEDGIIY